MKVETMSPEEFLYRQTEEFALKKELEEKNWNESYEAEEEKLIAQIDSRLEEHSPEAWDTLLTTFQAPKLHEIYADREQLAIVYILLNIYQYERYEELSPVIFEQGTNLEQFNNLIREMKFLLWHISFFDMEHHTESGYGDVGSQVKELLDYVEAHSFSPVALFFLVKADCVEPQKMLLYLANEYMEQNKPYDTMMILKYYDTYYPGNQNVKNVLSEMEKING